MIKTSIYDTVNHISLSRKLFGINLYWTSAYYVDGLLIDSGSHYTSPELGQFLKDKPLHTLINTHCHEDHIGGNNRLSKLFPSMTIYVHPNAIPILKNPKLVPLHPYRKLLFGYPQPSCSVEVTDNEIIKTHTHTFQVIYTPGHSKNHICIYEPEREWLFTGDLFIGGEDKATRLNYDMWGIIASLKKVSALPIKYLFPGSARVRKNPKQDLKNKIDYLEDLGETIIKLHKQGLPNPEIVKKLFPTKHLMEFLTLGHFSGKRLIDSFLGQNEFK